MTDHSVPIVIDFGSSHIRAGFAGESVPRSNQSSDSLGERLFHLGNIFDKAGMHGSH